MRKNWPSDSGDEVSDRRGEQAAETKQNWQVDQGNSCVTNGPPKGKMPSEAPFSCLWLVMWSKAKAEIQTGKNSCKKKTPAFSIEKRLFCGAAIRI